MIRSKLPSRIAGPSPNDLHRRMAVNVSRLVDKRAAAGLQVVPATLTYGCDGLPRLNPLDGTGCDPDPSGQLVLGARLNGTMTLLTKAITPQLAGGAASLGRREQVVIPGPAPRTPRALYVAMNLTAGGNPDTSRVSLFKSINGGATWVLTGPTYGFGANANLVVVDPSNPLNVFVTSPTKLFKSSDAGASWTDITTAIGWVPDALLCDPASAQLYASKQAGAKFATSTDGGVSWTSATTGLPDAIYSMAVGAGSVVYAAVSGWGLYTWDGTSWTGPVNDLSFGGDGPPNVIAASRVAGKLWAGLSAPSGHVNIYESLDGGATWTAHDGALLPTQDDRTFALWEGPHSGLWANIQNLYPLGDGLRGIYQNTTGTTWARSLTDPTGVASYLTSLVFDPIDTLDRIIYVANAYTGGGMWKTTNAGLDWLPVAGLPAQPINALAMQ